MTRRVTIRQLDGRTYYTESLRLPDVVEALKQGRALSLRDHRSNRDSEYVLPWHSVASIAESTPRPPGARPGGFPR
jgi:hypothetical protein